MRTALTGPLSAGLLLLACTTALPFQAGKGKKPGTLSASCDRPDALYKVGDKVTFHVEGLEDGPATYRLSEDGARTVAEGKVTADGGKATLTGSLKAPG